jgi:hypothetical protein
MLLDSTTSGIQIMLKLLRHDATLCSSLTVESRPEMTKIGGGEAMRMSLSRNIRPCHGRVGSNPNGMTSFALVASLQQ